MAGVKPTGHQPDIEVKDSKATILAHDDGTGEFEALASVTNIVDHGNDLIEPGAYTKTLRARPKVRLLRGHDWGRIAGKVVKMEELFPGDRRLPADLLAKGAGALWVKGQYNLGTQEGREAYADLKFAPEIYEMSIGYDCSPDETGPRAYKDRDGVRRIKSLTLLECSDVVVGMAPGTRALCYKALNAGVLNPERKYSISELVSIATKVYSQEQADESEGSTTAEVTPEGKFPNYEPEDGVDVGEDIHPIPLVPFPEEDDSRGSEPVDRKRLTAGEWAHRFARWVETKDDDGSGNNWEEYDEERGAGGGSQSSSSGSSSTTQSPSTSTTFHPPKSEGESGESSSRLAPVASLLSKATETVDSLKDIYKEGSEMGHEYAEQVATPGRSLTPFKSARIGEMKFDPESGEFKHGWDDWDAQRGSGRNRTDVQREAHAAAHPLNLAIQKPTRTEVAQEGPHLMTQWRQAADAHMDAAGHQTERVKPGDLKPGDQILRRAPGAHSEASPEVRTVTGTHPSGSPSSPYMTVETRGPRGEGRQPEMIHNDQTLRRVAGKKSLIGELRLGSFSQTLAELKAAVIDEEGVPIENEDSDGYVEDDDGVDFIAGPEPEDAALRHGRPFDEGGRHDMSAMKSRRGLPTVSPDDSDDGDDDGGDDDEGDDE